MRENRIRTSPIVVPKAQVHGGYLNKRRARNARSRKCGVGEEKMGTHISSGLVRDYPAGKEREIYRIVLIAT
jgi:hypothetical protein